MKLYHNGEIVSGQSDDSFNLEEDNAIMCMANLLGKDIRVPKKLPFSFYFSTQNSPHGIRVKPVFNPEKMSISTVGNLWLCDAWEYTPGKYDSNVSAKEIRKMKAFFRKYKVLFCGVWCGKIQETPVTDYFRNRMSFSQLLTNFEFYETYKDDMDDIEDVHELEEFVRENDLFNLYN